MPDFRAFFLNHEKQFIAGFAVLLVIVSGLGVLWPRSSEQLPVIVDSSHWKIAQSEAVSANIIWQKSETRVRADAFSGTENSGLAVSSRSAIYHQISEDWAEGQLVAFDLFTGQVAWHISDFMTNFRNIMIAGDSFVLISDAGSSLTRLSPDGLMLWRNTNFPSRFLQQGDFEENRLLLPSYDLVYEVSEDTGDMVHQYAVPKIVAVLGDIALIAEDTTRLQVVSFPAQQPLYSIELLGDYSVPIGLALVDQYAFAQRDGNVLLLYNHPAMPREIRAYSIDKGQFLWSLRVETLGLPIVVNHRLLFYTPSGLEIYSLATGGKIGSVTFAPNPQNSIQILPPTTVWLGGYGNTVVVNFRDSWELIAIHLVF